MDMVNSHMQKLVDFMKVNGNMVLCKEQENYIIKIENLLIKVNGKTILLMEKDNYLIK